MDSISSLSGQVQMSKTIESVLLLVFLLFYFQLAPPPPPMWCSRVAYNGHTGLSWPYLHGFISQIFPVCLTCQNNRRMTILEG